MRPKLSALTTTILGAVLTASIVSAQQSPKVDPVPRARAEAPDAQEGSDPQLGGSASRGARYLLRNGLDYLKYQQYERALKFLREAENRQKELNSAEKLSLKKGIERAQRGLREAADAEAPYAISDRSHRGKGFTAAKAEIEIATTNGRRDGARSQIAAQQETPYAQERSQRSESIQLASADQFVPDSAPSLASHADTQASLSEATERAKRLPVVPAVTTAAKVDDSHTGASADGADLLASLPPLAPANDSSVGSATAITAAKGDQAAVKAARVTIAPDGSATSAAQAVKELAGSPVAMPGDSATSPSTPSEAPAVIDLERITLPTDLNPTTPVAANKAAANVEPDVNTTSAPGSKTMGISAGALPAADSSSTLANAPGVDDLPPLPAVIGQSGEAPVREPAIVPVQSELSNLPKPIITGLPATAPGESGTPHLENEPLDRKTAIAEPAGTPGASSSGDPALERTQTATPIEQPPAAISPEARPERTPVAPAADFELPELPMEINSTAAAKRAEVPRPTDAPLAATALTAASAAAPAQAPAPYPTSNPNLESPAAPVGLETGLENPAPPAQPTPLATSRMERRSPLDLPFPDRPTPPSTLRPDLQHEVEVIARRQEDELKRRMEKPAQPATGRGETTAAAELRAQTQLDISRAPSPAEARPIKAIPVPEDWVPLPERDWSPQRKYWSAAATCHLPLYFQDPVLERYGHSVEQFVGPFGRYLSYPLDDPTQSNQRNQLVQPWFSIGLFGLQIAAWPYNLIMDPPWEAQYDLGYYRPGDRIPTDLYWLPLHGYGPPLRGSRY